MNKKEKDVFGLTDRDIKTLQDIFKKHPELKNHIDRVGLPFYEKLVGEEQMPEGSAGLD